MEHAASPSLIALGLTADTSSEGSSFRWGLVSSCVLHALVIVVAMFIRFQSEKEQPFRTIDVSLISSPSLSTSTPRPAPSSKKTAIVTPTQKIAPSPMPPAAPVEEVTLPPLPTETALERLSESLRGAIHSIIVPQIQMPNSSTIPVQEPERHPAEDQSPLLDSLSLPSAPPTIARPKRLQPAEPLKSLPSPAPLSQAKVPPNTQDPVKAPVSPSSPPPAATIQPSVKPAPALPSLSEVTPFTKPESNSEPPRTRETSSIEESLKRNIPNVPTPPSKPIISENSKRRTASPLEPNAATPKISAPQLATIPETPRPKTSGPPQSKLSDTVKKLMEGLKSTTRPPAPSSPQMKPSPTTQAITPVPSAIDQQIAKLSIPEVAPVESIKQRLQLLEVQAGEGQGGSTAQTSSGKNRYLAMVEDRIDSQWAAPPLLASNPVVILKFHIARSGEISRVQLTESSGNAYYDSAAQRAVHAVNPLPPFPADISDSFFDVQYRFIKD
ncbi:MAG: TonB family protein [Nitrospirales bacterium]